MRIASHIVLIISVLFFPWWLTALLLAAACFANDHFYEAVIYGIAFDSIYRSDLGVYGFHYAASLFAAIMFTLSLFLRKQLSW